MKKLILVQAILLLLQIILYFGCEIFQHRFHDVKRKIDDSIPFLPFTSVFYSLWFPLIAVFPIALYYVNTSGYTLYMAAMVLEIVLSVICYLLYPTTFERPKPSDTLFGNAMKLVYKGSYRGLNCAPSLHCSSCYLILWICCTCEGMPAWMRLAGGITAVLIVISTMTTKQHTVIDVVSAAGMFLACLLLGKQVPMQWLLNYLQN